MKVNVYSKVDICTMLGITEAEFRHAKEDLKFEHTQKIDGYLYYSDLVVDAIKKYRENMGKPCKGQTLDLFKEKRVTLEDIDKRLDRIEKLVNLWNLTAKSIADAPFYGKERPVLRDFGKCHLDRDY